jgi:hypothetical protein
MPYGYFVEVNPGDSPGHDLPGHGHIGGLPPGVNIPGHELPAPPPGMWPPPTGGAPIAPAPPNTPPGAIWPPPNLPSHALPGAPPGTSGQAPNVPSQGLPGASGGAPSQGLPSTKFWVVCGIPGVGWRYVCVDPSLVAGTPAPPAPAPKA